MHHPITRSTPPEIGGMTSPKKSYPKIIILRYYGALLDLDGTLTANSDLLQYQNTRMFLERYGVDLTLGAYINEWMMPDGRGLRGIIEDYSLKERYGLTPERARQEREAIFAEFFMHKLEPRKGAMRLLDEWQGIKKAIVTQNYRSRAEQIVHVCGFGKYVQHIVSSEDVTHDKPHPEPYYAGAALIKVPAQHCIAVEDTPKGILSAKRAGVGLVIAYPNGLTKKMDFTGEAKPDITVDSLEEILRLDLFGINRKH